MHKIVSDCKEIIKDKKLTKTDVEFIASLVELSIVRTDAYYPRLDIIYPEVLQALEGYKELTEDNLYSLAIAGITAYEELYKE